MSAAAERDERPMLVIFHDPTCGRCRRADGFLAQVLQRRRNHSSFRVRRVDVGQRPDLRDRFRVQTVPAFVVVDDGSVKGRLTEPRGCQDIQELLSPWLH